MVKSKRRCEECGRVFSVTRDMLDQRKPFICNECRKKKELDEASDIKETGVDETPEFAGDLMEGNKDDEGTGKGGKRGRRKKGAV